MKKLPEGFIMPKDNTCINCASIFNEYPHATAMIRGSADYPSIWGVAHFYQTNMGVLMAIEITGLPTSENRCESPVFGFHIHNGMSCTGTDEDPFANAGTHYNPYNCAHPHHAGDLPPLFGNNGYAFLAFFTDRFEVSEIVGRTIVVHSMPDDFTTQPAGNPGAKIACGVIYSSDLSRPRS